MNELPLLLRRSKVSELTGLPKRQLRKVVAAGMLQPVYLVWDVIQNERVLFSATEDKARAFAATHRRAIVRPTGQPYFRRDQVISMLQ